MGLFDLLVGCVSLLFVLVGGLLVGFVVCCFGWDCCLLLFILVI